MKRKILFLLPILALSLCSLSCKKDDLSDFQELVNYIYQSEQALAGYNEESVIKDGELEIYNKDVNFIIQRGEKVKSEVVIVEKKLSTSGEAVYDEVATSYKTVDNIKYVEINGTTYENAYTMPTYYLTFVLSEDFLEDGYELSKDEDNFTLKAKVLDNKISSLFLNKSLGTVSNLSIEISIKGGKLMSFNAKYKSANDFVVSIYTDYLYAESGIGKAVFYLEGGVCQNTKDRVSYLYEFDGSKIDMLIVDPNILETDPQDQISKTGYHIEGWYQTKTVNPDGTVEYSDKWDFENDRMTINGVTLYAKWEINRVYSYELYYYDENNEEVLLSSYEVEEGEKFYDLFLDVKNVDGYTSLGYLDENGKEWDEDFVHPGGDADLAIKVYLNLIEGEYAIVKTKRQLSSAISKNQDIYIYNDIDIDGDEISFDSYSGLILGNGYKITNFEFDYDSSRNGLKGDLEDLEGTSDHLYISLFFELKDATIKDLTFSDFTIDINTNYSQIKYLIIAPFAIKASNTTLENVKINGKIKFTKVPECEIEVIYNDFWYNTSENVAVDQNSSAIIVEE